MLSRSVLGASSAFNGKGTDHIDRLSLGSPVSGSEIFLILFYCSVTLMELIMGSVSPIYEA